MAGALALAAVLTVIFCATAGFAQDVEQEDTTATSQAFAASGEISFAGRARADYLAASKVDQRTDLFVCFGSRS